MLDQDLRSLWATLKSDPVGGVVPVSLGDLQGWVVGVGLLGTAVLGCWVRLFGDLQVSGVRVKGLGFKVYGL
jgi:hypothetical protein